jgi:aspartate ammonia-lyase
MRTERDAFGEVALPAGALYGIQTARAVENLSFSGRQLRSYPLLIRALARVKMAASRANRAAGIVDTTAAEAIERAAAQIAAGQHDEQFPVDVLGGGGSIGINANINEVAANLANEVLGGVRGSYQPVHPKQHVNASQSTADVCHTAFRLAVMDAGGELREVLRVCETRLSALAAATAAVPTLARTCLQDAMPVSLGTLFGAHRAAVARRAAELERSANMLTVVNLGGTVIGSGAGAPAAYRAAVPGMLAAIVGRSLTLRPDLYDAAQHIDDLVAVSSQLALLAETLIKIAQDLRLLSSGPRGGFGEISLPVTQEGSSFFAGKVNPVVPETLLQCGLQVLGCDRAAHLALERGEPSLNVFEGVAAINLLDAMRMLAAGVRLFADRCLAGITANEPRCRELAALAVAFP